MIPVNSVRLNKILIELEELGDELEEIQQSQTNPTIGYEISECESALCDARVALRTSLTH